MQLLFASNPVSEHVDAFKAALLEDVRGWDPDELLQLPEQDVIDYLVERSTVTCPVLRRAEAFQEPVSRIRTDGSPTVLEFRPWPVDEARLVLVVPYDGDEGLFRLRPHSRSNAFHPRQADLRDGELRLVWTGRDGDPQAVQQFFDQQLDTIEQDLASLRRDLAAFHRSLPELARRFVSSRRADLLADRHLQAALTFPIRRRDDAATYEIPIRRKKLAVQRPAASPGPFQPEPQLSTQAYEEALAVLRNARNALERSPSLTAKLHEPQIRDLLLLFLNAQFEGQAGGEVFNYLGKTDILIRVEDRLVFIAECKVWKSPATIRDGLDQLLSRYLPWRDTKAAFLLFIREAGVTSIIQKAIIEIEQHPSRKRTLPSAQPDERRDFVFRANDDQDREIRLAFMPFVLGQAARQNC